jgi:SAM-dependent methyltransferase
MDKEYDQYLRGEWELFARDTRRAQASLEALRRPPSQVLDIGCGAGQELLPFVRAGALGIGTDIAPDTGVLARELFGREGLASRTGFLRSAAEHLPFASGSFDLIVSRLALPYTDNSKAIAEMARVLAPDGVLFLKIHHAGFYLNKAWRGLLTGKFLHIVHAMRVLCSGAIYHATGKQTRNRIVTNETFQTRWLLTRELARQSLVIERLMPDSNWMTPSFAITRDRLAARPDSSG